MSKQVKTKKRVADHGEVFTAEREVNAMLDLVKNESERIESRFLEPACGDGNFLAKIIERKLQTAKSMYKKYLSDYERNSILALTSIYGIDLLSDNAQTCRDRLFNIWEKEYTSIAKKNVNNNLKDVAKYILSLNIVTGNALSMKCVDNNQQDLDQPIIFPEWSFINDYLIKRRDFRFDVLLKEHEDEYSYDTQLSIFSDDANYNDYWMIDPVTNETIPKPVKEYQPIDYRRLYENE